MNLEELKQLMQNKLNAEQQAKNSAYMNGDVNAYTKAEENIKNIEEIILKLNN